MHESLLPEELEPNRSENSLDLPDMVFSSSPVEYPPSSGAPALQQKRKLFKSFTHEEPVTKKRKLSLPPQVILPSLSDTEVAKDVQQSHQEEAVHELSDAENDFTYRPAINLSKNTSHTSREESPLSDLRPSPLEILPPSHFNRITTHKGQTIELARRKRQPAQTYESIIAERSTTKEGRAKRAYYGVEVHHLVDEAKIQHELNLAAKELVAQKAQELLPTIERPVSRHRNNNQYQMWTEKYRATKFTDLVGDERTHRQVLKWLKAWDQIVFPGNSKPKPKRMFADKDAIQDYQHRKILLLTGPPGLGKTTLAHVCAKQAGYGVLEINASDDRSRDVVKGRIKDALGTETVRGIRETGKARKAGRPVCVVVDEVDGVVTGSSGSGGEGGFIKALIDLVQLDQKNSSPTTTIDKTKKKGERFRLLRPLILICNDVYAPSLRPLRTSSIAELVHVRKPPLDKVIARLKIVFEKESILYDNDAVRQLCEASWALGSRKQNTLGARSAGEGDIRGVLVQGEWLAHKLTSTSDANARLTRKWVESTLSSTTSDSKGLGRGGLREIVDRIFIEGAGLSSLPTTLSADDHRLLSQSTATPLGVADLRKRAAINALNSMISTTGDHDRLATDLFSIYPTRVFQDDTFLSKPNSAYDWLHFHDSVSSRIYVDQEWELMPYLSTAPCAFHDLFASVDRGATSWSNQADTYKAAENEAEKEQHPFAGLKADFSAHEAEKVSRSSLTELQGNFPAELLRLFSSTDTIASELIPQLSRMLTPDVKPVIVGGVSGSGSVASVRKESERRCVSAGAQVMHALKVSFERMRVESEGYGNAGTVYRMEPPIDELSTFHLGDKAKPAQTRFAVRQVLDQELHRYKTLEASRARLARGNTSFATSPFDTANVTLDDKENLDPTIRPSDNNSNVKPIKIKKDFFGRVVASTPLSAPDGKIDAEALAKSTARKGRAANDEDDASEGRIWVSFHEGFSNAVRKPLTLKELLDSF